MNDKDDVGTAVFDVRPKTMYLMRYIRKAIDNGSIIVLNKNK